MRHLGEFHVINKIITIKDDIITIRYKKEEISHYFSEVHDISLTKIKIKKNVIALKITLIILTLYPILFFFINHIYAIFPYVLQLLLSIYFKSNRYEQGYFLKIILNNGSRSRLRIHSKDRLNIIIEITNYIDYRFKKSMQEFFMDLNLNETIYNIKVS